jgi:hypothetical protein
MKQSVIAITMTKKSGHNNHRNENGILYRPIGVVSERERSETEQDGGVRCVPRLIWAIVAVAYLTASVGVVLWEASEKNKSRATSPSVFNEFMNGLPVYSLELARGDANSSQAKALAWLQNTSMSHEYELHRLYQRYALAVLYHSTNGPSWVNSTGWLTNDNECTWYACWSSMGGTCIKGSRFSRLDLPENGLSGTIPMELELLSDLDKITLFDDNLSGMKDAKLYVLITCCQRIACHPGLYLTFRAFVVRAVSVTAFPSWKSFNSKGPSLIVPSQRKCKLWCLVPLVMITRFLTFSCLWYCHSGLLSSLHMLELHDCIAGTIPTEM